MIVQFLQGYKNGMLVQTLSAVFNVSLMKDLLCETWSLLNIIKAGYKWIGHRYFCYGTK